MKNNNNNNNSNSNSNSNNDNSIESTNEVSIFKDKEQELQFRAIILETKKEFTFIKEVGLELELIKYSGTYELIISHLVHEVKRPFFVYFNVNHFEDIIKNEKELWLIYTDIIQAKLQSIINEL